MLGEEKGKNLHANEGRNVSPRKRFHTVLTANKTTLQDKRDLRQRWIPDGGHRRTLARAAKLYIPFALYLNPMSVPQRHGGPWSPFFVPLPNVATFSKPVSPFAAVSLISISGPVTMPPLSELPEHKLSS